MAVLVIGALCFGLSVSFLAVTAIKNIQSKAGDYEERYLAAADQQLDALFVFISPDDLWRISIGCSTCGFIGGVLLGFRHGLTPMLILSFMLAGVLFFVPRLVLSVLVFFRKKKFMQQFPDAIGVMGNGLKAGLGMLKAIEIVASEMPPPISQEFGLIIKDRQYGRPMEECIARLVSRMPLPDVKIFAMMVKLSARMGGDVTVAFNKLAETIRNRFAIEKKVKSLSADARMQAMVIVLMPFLFAALMSSIAPEMMDPLMQSRWKYLVFGVIIVLEAVGGFAMWKVSRVKY